jgi:hypothetical protein
MRSFWLSKDRCVKCGIGTAIADNTVWQDILERYYCWNCLYPGADEAKKARVLESVRILDERYGHG